jgi:hypothetical protein
MREKNYGNSVPESIIGTDKISEAERILAEGNSSLELAKEKDYVIKDKDFADTEPMSAHHDFLDSDTADNSRVVGLNLTEAPGDLLGAKAELYTPPPRAKVYATKAEIKDINELLADSSQLDDTIPNRKRDELREATLARKKREEDGFFNRLKRLFQ